MWKRNLRRWVNRNRRTLKKVAIGAVGLLIMVQLFYPGDRMPWFASVDSERVGGQKKSDVIKKLDALASDAKLTVAFGTINKKFDQPSLGDVGIGISNQKRIEQATYPWYLRVIPTSLLWFGLLQNEQAPVYSSDEAVARRYVVQKFGENCVVAPKDATLELKDKKLQVVHASAGGTSTLR